MDFIVFERTMFMVMVTVSTFEFDLAFKHKLSHVVDHNINRFFFRSWRNRVRVIFKSALFFAHFHPALSVRNQSYTPTLTSAISANTAKQFDTHKRWLHRRPHLLALRRALPLHRAVVQV